jgi:hypothetical protein
MKIRKIPWRWLLAGLAVFLAAGIAAPFFSADRFGERIGKALEASLGRKVKIGKVRFGLFGGPGFTISDVEIAEDPAFGIEPLAQFSPEGSLDARIQLKSLWTGKLEWASLRLNGPIVNLVKTDSGHWNFEPLTTPKLVEALPRIEVRDGRINFKFGDTKSKFYVDNVDLDAVARSNSAADWDLRFSGEPGRTDRVAHPYNQSVTGKGRWRPDRVNFDIELERSALQEISGLIFGRDVGIHGTAASRVQLAGPANNIQINGSLQLQDLHRWDQMPMKGDGWPLNFRGRLDLTTQRLEMESLSGPLPFTVRYRVSDYLSQPRSALGVSWNRFPVEPLVAIARHMGAPLPEDVKLAGTLDGAVSWSGSGNLQGQIAFHDAAVTFPNSPPVEFHDANVFFGGDRIHLARALARTADSEASLEADYGLTTQDLQLDIESESMTIAAIRTHAARLPAPLLEALRSGVWKGKLRYRRGPDIEEGWSGQIQLAKAEIPLPGLADPLRVRSATARLDGPRLWVDKMVARVGAADLAGDYRYEPGAIHPHRFRLTIPEIEASELERLLMPTLRRNQGFLARTLGIGKSEIPAWLAERFMDGTLQIGQLTVGDAELSRVRFRVRQNGARVDLTDMEARLENGSAYGRVSLDLAGRIPAYRVNFVLDSIDFKGGKIDASGVIRTAGTGRELLTRIRSEGSFTGRALDICKTASGCYRLEWPRLRFTELQLLIGPDLFIGRGATQDDGSLLLQLSSGAKQMRVTGTLARLAVEGVNP